MRDNKSFPPLFPHARYPHIHNLTRHYSTILVCVSHSFYDCLYRGVPSRNRSPAEHDSLLMVAGYGCDRGSRLVPPPFPFEGTYLGWRGIAMQHFDVFERLRSHAGRAVGFYVDDVAEEHEAALLHARGGSFSAVPVFASTGLNGHATDISGRITLWRMKTNVW